MESMEVSEKDNILQASEEPPQVFGFPQPAEEIWDGRVIQAYVGETPVTLFGSYGESYSGIVRENLDISELKRCRVTGVGICRYDRKENTMIWKENPLFQHLSLDRKHFEKIKSHMPHGLEIIIVK